MSYTSSEARHVGDACAGLSILTLGCRIIISRWRREQIDMSFFVVILSAVIIAGRVIANNYYLEYVDSDDTSHLELGSILILVARFLLTVILWLQICLLLLFYSRITSGIPWTDRLTKTTWITALLTFIAIVLATFLECRPINLYWQISPDPGQCTRAYVQLLLQCIGNIVIDILLLSIAYPLICLRKRSLSQYISLYTLFALGTLCIVITIIRVVLIFEEDSSQNTRSVWASVQIFVSCFVANAPTIYGSLRVAHRKRSGHRSAYGSGEVAARPSRPETDSWLKIDEEIALDRAVPNTPALPPPTFPYGMEITPALHPNR
ncbi:hypothetical protein GGR53DRAFT_256034 [Hypoxylon sp. FL1150]|nr:hypothetical protein GGR53DRAFT_256034 [Hypoxylon sp. FL1150]